MIEVTKDNFEQTVGEGVTLIDVWGPSCAPCLAIMPEVEKFADERSSDLKVAKLEAPKNRRLCMEHKIMGLPAFLLFRDGEEVSRLGGNEIGMQELRSWVDETLAGTTA